MCVVPLWRKRPEETSSIPGGVVPIECGHWTDETYKMEMVRWHGRPDTGCGIEGRIVCLLPGVDRKAPGEAEMRVAMGAVGKIEELR